MSELFIAAGIGLMFCVSWLMLASIALLANISLAVITRFAKIRPCLAEVTLWDSVLFSSLKLVSLFVLISVLPRANYVSICVGFVSVLVEGVV